MRGPENMCEPGVEVPPQTLSSRNLNKSVDFSEYMWMVEEEIEDFDKKCEEEFWEECWMQEAFEQMLEEEEASTYYYITPEEYNELLDNEEIEPLTELEAEMNNLNFISDNNTSSRTVSSALNPNAPEFVPRCLTPPQIEEVTDVDNWEEIHETDAER